MSGSYKPPDQSGGGSNTKIEVPFYYGDATPKVITTVNSSTTIFTAQIVIIQPFNGVTPTLCLGDSLQADRLILTSQNNPSIAAEYETNPGYTYSGSTTILLTIVPGSGCTQGMGYVLLEV